ncbi:hypothetical protein FKM82_004149 [Ascaphus truei]
MSKNSKLNSVTHRVKSISNLENHGSYCFQMNLSVTEKVHINAAHAVLLYPSPTLFPKISFKYCTFSDHVSRIEYFIFCLQAQWMPSKCRQTIPNTCRFHCFIDTALFCMTREMHWRCWRDALLEGYQLQSSRIPNKSV